MYSLIRCNTYNDPLYQLSKNNQNIPPGQLQYKILKNDILDLNLPQETPYYDSNWYFLPHTKENLDRLTPNTSTGLSYKWKIVLILSQGDCMKGVLQNQTNTDEYALISSLNQNGANNYTSRIINSKDPDFKITQSKMIAPARFWIEFKNRLMY